MGNQVTTLGQIYPVEYYLAEYCNDFTLDFNLGSTRFMKVARVKHKDAGYCVAKVYAINDPSIPILDYKLKVEEIRDKIRGAGYLHSLPFIHCLIDDKSIILLRQYIKYNLYDRLSTRPFLTSIEKRWIAYQLLRCIESLHKQSVYHGDIKSENVLVTSFLWITLADFAPYKPVVLPENNPSDFSYFFDTSRRHCCNMAPERLVEQANVYAESENTETWPSYTNDLSINQLTSQMDLFSLGCVLAELFSDDTPNSSMFDLGQILMYKKNQYNPNKFVEENISDSKVRKLILNLTDLDPNKRNSASYHLDKLVPSLFPAYFRTLYDYFSQLINLMPDNKILVLDKDLNKLAEEIITEDERGLLLPLILATSTLRSIKNVDAKLIGLKLCVRLVKSSPNIMSEYIIDRLLPYIVQLLVKSEPRLRALCVSSLSSVLTHIDSLQASDSNVFIDYILPGIQPLAFDNSTLVRIALADSVSELAQISKRFLNKEDSEHDQKLSLLHEAFKVIVTQLLVDPDNNVKRAILNEKIPILCDFFGPEKTDEVILSHMVTFLNDKNDFRLRASFFDHISCITKRLGHYYAPVVKPLMQKGLADSEEIVIYKCCKAITSMTELGLLSRDIVFELFQESIPLLSFPNKWIRNAVTNFILVLANTDQSIDFNRRILPAIKLHLNRDIHGLRDEIVLLDSLQNPLPRVVIESILNNEDDIDEIFNAITRRKVTRDQRRYRIISDTDTQDYDALIDETAIFESEKDILKNVDRFSEDRLIDSELILRKIHKNKLTSIAKPIEPTLRIRQQEVALQNQASVDSRLLLSSTVSLSRVTRPRGILLAHLHEHKGAVNRLLVVPGTTHFVSCSQDATIKFWDCAGAASRPQVLFRSKQTFISPDAGPVHGLSVCTGSDVLLSLTGNNNLHMLQLYSPSSQSRLLKSVNYTSEFSGTELVTDLVSLSPFTYATCSTSSSIRGYDLRLPTDSDVWSLRMEGSDGLITCLDGNEFCIACGTSSSVISMFDLRFYIRATTMSYPLYQDKMRKRIRRVVLCNDEIYCSVDRNNEVSTWECESASRTKTLWASPTPCLSSTHASHHSVLSMIVDSSKDTNSVITAGDDMKIRFWDLNNPHRSYVISRPPYNSHHRLASDRQSSSGKQQHYSDLEVNHQLPHCVYFQSKLIDGIQVIQETDKLPASSLAQSQTLAQSSQATRANVANAAASSRDNLQQASSAAETVSNVSGSSSLNPQDGISLSAAHHDSIGCLATVNQSSLLLSASRDGVIKIWR